MALLAVTAVHHWIREGGEVPRSTPNCRRRQDGGIETDDIVAQLHHRSPPGILDIAKHEDAERTIVIGGPEASVDLGRGKDEAPALGQVDHVVEEGAVGDGLAHGPQT